jgi:hypothetical protein
MSGNNQHHEESKQLIESTIRSARQTEQLGNNISTRLQQQGEQLQRAADNAQEISESLDHSDSILKRMGSYFAWMMPSYSSNKNTSSSKSSGSGLGARNNNQKITAGKTATGKERVELLNHSSSTTIQKSSNINSSSQLDEDQSLDELANAIKGIRAVSEHIGSQLDAQTLAISQLDEQLDTNSTKLSSVQSKTSKLINR